MDWNPESLLAVLAMQLAYLLGSVSGSLLLGRLRQVDIRTLGSGNAGGTNAFRTQGLRFALGVVVIDVGKGALAAGLLPALLAPGQAWLALACGMCSVVGHCYPVWHGFRGGKGAATAVGVLAVVQPLLLLPMLLVWFLVLMLSGYVSLATMLAGLSLLPAAWLQGAPAHMVWFGGTLGLFLLFTHRSNLRRLWQGRESRFEKARVIRRLRRSRPGT